VPIAALACGAATGRTWRSRQQAVNVSNNIIKGNMPILLTAAEQITVDEVAVQMIIWNPSAAGHTIAIYDNNNNPVFVGSIGSGASNLAPQVIAFPWSISCSGLVLKQISSGDSVLIYLTNI
jgi:hypothetical protein